MTKSKLILSSTIRPLLLLLLFSIAAKPVFPQYFSNLYYYYNLPADNSPPMLFGSIQYLNNNYYVTGVTTQTFSPFDEKGLFGRIAFGGTLDSIFAFIDTDYNTYNIFNNSLKRTADGNFLATGEMYDTLDRAFIVKWDTAGNILLWHTYSKSQYQSDLFQGQDVIEIPQLGYLLAVNYYDSIQSTQEVFLIRTDTAGNEIHEQSYFTENNELPWILRPMKNGHYMIGAVDLKPGYPSTPFWAHTWLIEVDSMCNEITNWYDPDPDNLWPNGMEQTADSGWIIVRQHLAYDMGNEQAYNASILKIDKNFNKEWEIDTGGVDDNAGMFDVKILSDGNYICSGQNPVTFSSDSFCDFGWIMKVSTTGQILWQQNYIPITRNGAEAVLYDINVLPNGDLLACGELNFLYNIGINPVQQAWIIRADSTGCEVNCSTAGIIEIATKANNLTIYPNPATNQLIISATGFLPAGEAWQPQTISIYNLNGQAACAAGRQLINLPFAQEIDISTLPAGVYFVEVTGTQTTEVRKLVKL